MSDEIPTSETPEAAINAFVDEDDKPREEAPRREAAPKAAKEEPQDEEEKESAKEEEKPARSYKIKANGREKELPAEVLEAFAAATEMDPGMLLRGAQMFRAGQESKREAAEALKKAEALASAFKSDPRAALLSVGKEEALKIAIGLVKEQMEEDELRTQNPQELERRKALSEVEKLRAEKEALAKEAATREESAYQDKVAADLNKQITTALEAGKIPKEPYVLKRLASYIHDHVNEENVDDLTIEDYLPVVLEEMEAEHTQFLGKLSGDDLIERFPAMAEKVREAFTKRVRRGAPPARQPERREAPRPNGQAKRMGTGGALDAFLHDD